MRRSAHIALCTSLILVMHAPSAQTAGVEGRWEGFITTEPGKLTLFLVELSAGPDGWTGSAEVPGTAGIPLPALRVETGAIHFDLGDDPEPYVFDGRRREDAITGELVLGDSRLPVELRRRRCRFTEGTHRPKHGARCLPWRPNRTMTTRVGSAPLRPTLPGCPSTCVIPTGTTGPSISRTRGLST